MMNRALSTAAPINAIGVYGLVSFLYGGERLDLYTFYAVSLALLCLLWPRRLEWEAMFKEFSAKYPGVASIHGSQSHPLDTPPDWRIIEPDSERSLY